MLPSWDLIVVLEGICEPLFETLESLDPRMLSHKTAAGTGSVKHVGDLHGQEWCCISFELCQTSLLTRRKVTVVLCEIYCLPVELKHTQAVLSSGQLFVERKSVKPLSKHCLSHWIVEAISIAYKIKISALPAGGMTTSWALFRSVSVEDI